MSNEEQAGYDEVHELLRPLQAQYPSHTLDELHELFDETYERVARELATQPCEMK